MGKIAVYPGSFDPITKGHLDIIMRGSKLFDRLIVAVLKNQSKKSMFSIDERVDMLKQIARDIPNVEVDMFSGLLVDYCKDRKVNAIIRGLRAISDFEYELQMAQMNRQLNQEVETIFLTTSTQYSFLSSSLVKEVASLNGDISEFVPDIVLTELNKKLKGDV
ncbi:MAG: pantetheine-phosphate adenylyltransferase [Peptoclostridium sp.]|uniref:pantetheine-phosphate adenylyltransferase n=1 Tax=Peptoclostridium sp. TaxID=1904860 RepID=UPI00139B2D6A|nr:pantetheine-phosphate adenylyltransferase [Peptoclostridium sp.]MZQ76323.1 pantetheine-phosphate adenylyltransferase [Peptoclostridium sp.]